MATIPVRSRIISATRTFGTRYDTQSYPRSRLGTSGAIDGAPVLSLRRSAVIFCGGSLGCTCRRLGDGLADLLLRCWIDRVPLGLERYEDGPTFAASISPNFWSLSVVAFVVP